VTEDLSGELRARLARNQETCPKSAIFPWKVLSSYGLEKLRSRIN
jgi:hypothetical protein